MRCDPSLDKRKVFASSFGDKLADFLEQFQSGCLQSKLSGQGTYKWINRVIVPSSLVFVGIADRDWGLGMSTGQRMERWSTSVEPQCSGQGVPSPPVGNSRGEGSHLRGEEEPEE